ncbi:dipeptide epimerase [Prolixibacteraceae bacterium Z1-6]|uniref:Dipeptide epimerase n=1 Tax=Draconibacterium aestuarii TaxID=2998507 RepID=A0A9X3J5B6_9BACT|nr:dipeptide epimerase [Prolixibacteraceae bacterium Z1-6]
MKITGVEYFRLEMPLAIPYTIAYETVTKATNIILKIDTDKGITGWGCASPDKEVTGETSEDVIENTEKVITGILRGESPFQLAKTMHLLKQQLPGAASSLAMVDMALHDLLARKAKLPLYQVLGGFRHEVETSITIGILPLAETLDQARYYLKKGFSIIKLKGGLNVNADVEKIIKLRERLGNEFLLRFDANQGYSPEESIEFLNQTKNSGIEIFEQPTSPKKEDKLEVLAGNSDVPVMADESLKTLKDAFRLANNNLTDMVNIKLMKVGGIQEAQHINSVAKASGMDVMVGCIDECALGISAGLHFTLSRPNITYADLDGHLDLLEDPFTDLFKMKNGILYPSKYPGLGKINI